MPSLVTLKKAARKPPMTGEGKGKGMPGGGRRGKHKKPCPDGGPGYGKGEGRGKGKMRKRSELIGKFSELVKYAELIDSFADLQDEQKQAFVAGMQTGLQDTLPSPEAFKKVAEALRVPTDLLVRAVMAKRASLPGLLLAGGLTYGGLTGLESLKNRSRRGGGYGRPHMGMIGGLSPKAQSDVQRMIMRSALRNYQVSELLNQMRAANPMTFRPVI